MRHDDSIRDDLPELVLGTHGTSRAREVRRHLEECDLCRRELASIESALVRLAEGSSTLKPSAGLEDRILQALPQKKNSRPLVWAALAAALILALGGNVVQWWNASPQAKHPGFSVIVLQGPKDGQQVYGTLMLGSDHQGLLAVRGLPGADRYRLWIVHDHQWTSVGTFSVASDGSGSLAVRIPAGLKGVQAFCVSKDEGEVYYGEWVLQGTT